MYIIYNESIGYALMKNTGYGFYQQISKWYWRLGNLKRFNNINENLPVRKTR